MTVHIVETWESITCKPMDRPARVLFFRLSCGCVAKVDQMLLLATCTNELLARTMNQLAELHRCPNSQEPLQLPDTPGDAGRPGG